MKKLTSEQQSKIYKKLQLNNSNSIVLIDISEAHNISRDENNLNVYLIDKDYKVIWQIDAKDTAFNKDMFVSIKISDQGELIAKRFSGFKYKVDIKTGKGTEIGWDK